MVRTNYVLVAGIVVYLIQTSEVVPVHILLLHWDTPMLGYSIWVNYSASRLVCQLMDLVRGRKKKH